jgi:Zn-finger nucleic acid-binding protein
MDILFPIAAVLFSIVSPILIRYRRRHRKISLPGTSILLTYYSDGVSFTPINKGRFGELEYVVMAGFASSAEHGESSAIYQIALPYASRIHLVGIPKKYKNTQLDPTGNESIMEAVVLEGDYPNYFSLYAEKGMQTESRYALDPKAMVFTVEFCQSFNWEIVDNQLYVIQTSGGIADEDVDMSKTVLQFVKEIKPAIALPLTDSQVSQITPYDEEYRKGLTCPLCATTLKKEQDFLACPRGDGILLKGGALTRLYAGALTVQRNYLSGSPDTKALLTCPGCGTAMTKVPYRGSATIIDSCSHCPYRWLDAVDISSI